MVTPTALDGPAVVVTGTATHPGSQVHDVRARGLPRCVRAG